MNKIWLRLCTPACSVSVWQNQGSYQQCVTTHRLADLADGPWDVWHTFFQGRVSFQCSKTFLYESDHLWLILHWQGHVVTSLTCTFVCLSFRLCISLSIILPYHPSLPPYWIISLWGSWTNLILRTVEILRYTTWMFVNLYLLSLTSETRFFRKIRRMLLSPYLILQRKGKLELHTKINIS